MRIKFKSAATALSLCLVFQVQADSRNAWKGGRRTQLREIIRMVNTEVGTARELIKSC